MAIKDKGVKRCCSECGSHFFDLNKNPIKCPKCGHQSTLEELLKSRQSAAAIKASSKKSDEDGDLDIGVDELDSGFSEEKDNDELDILEDTSDLGDDSEDMAEVFDNIGGKDE